MALRYSPVPLVHYGDDTARLLVDADWRNRFPPEARPIAEAPLTSGRPITVYEPSGEPHWALYYRGAWRRVTSTRDPHTGETRTQMDGTAVPNAVMWKP